MNKTLHQYDPKDLSDYLVSHVPGFSKLKEIEKFSDGQSNPTYKVTDITGTNYVLRAKPPGQLLKSAHAGTCDAKKEAITYFYAKIQKSYISLRRNVKSDTFLGKDAKSDIFLRKNTNK